MTTNSLPITPRTSADERASMCLHQVASDCESNSQSTVARRRRTHFLHEQTKGAGQGFGRDAFECRLARIFTTAIIRSNRPLIYTYSVGALTKYVVSFIRPAHRRYAIGLS